MIYLPQPPNFEGYRHVPPYPPAKKREKKMLWIVQAEENLLATSPAILLKAKVNRA